MLEDDDSVVVVGGGGEAGCGVSVVAVGVALEDVCVEVVLVVGSWVLSLVTSVTGGAGATGRAGWVAVRGAGVAGAWAVAVRSADSGVAAGRTAAGGCLRRWRWACRMAAAPATPRVSAVEGWGVERTTAGTAWP